MVEEPVKNETPVEGPIKEEIPAEKPVKDETTVVETPTSGSRKNSRRSTRIVKRRGYI